MPILNFRKLKKPSGASRVRRKIPFTLSALKGGLSGPVIEHTSLLCIKITKLKSNLKSAILLISLKTSLWEKLFLSR